MPLAPDAPPTALGELRERIAAVDRALLELLRYRMDLAGEVGRSKAAAGAPVVVRDVEDRVLSRARDHADACGVSGEVMESIFQSIIRGSVERQHRIGIDERRERAGLEVLVVGGAGGMGSWLRNFFSLVGHHVEIVDPVLRGLPAEADAHAELPADLDRFDAIVVAVPLATTVPVISDLVRRRPRGLLVEITSIKAPLTEVARQAAELGVRLASLHPMFGPGKSPWEELTFVLATLGDTASTRTEIDELLRHPYTRLVVVPFEHHDRLMGWLLGLAHLTGMLFGQALTRSGLDPAELHACASTTFRRQAATATSVLGDDPDLYLDIQRLNPHRTEVYAAARGALDELIGLVESGDRDGFRTTLARARRALEKPE